MGFVVFYRPRGSDDGLNSQLLQAGDLVEGCAPVEEDQFEAVFLFSEQIGHMACIRLQIFQSEHIAAGVAREVENEHPVFIPSESKEQLIRAEAFFPGNQQTALFFYRVQRIVDRAAFLLQ